MNLPVKKMKSLGKREKEILDIIAKTKEQYEQYERYLVLTSITDTAKHTKPENYPAHDWCTPLDITLYLGEKYSCLLGMNY